MHFDSKEIQSFLFVDLGSILCHARAMVRENASTMLLLHMRLPVYAILLFCTKYQNSYATYFIPKLDERKSCVNLMRQSLTIYPLLL